MNKIRLSLLCLFLAVWHGSAQDQGLLPSILYLTGASDVESVPEDEMERLLSYSEKPLRINFLSESSLSSSGLLSAYQAASLSTYIEGYGDVVSTAELAAVDGFGAEFAEALRPFVSFEVCTLPGNRGRYRYSSHEIEGAAFSRLTIPVDGASETEAAWGSSLRYRFSYADKVDMSLGIRKTADDRLAPSQATGYIAYYGRRLSIVVGDCALRYGQGLALWTGFSMSGLSGTRSLWKRSTGFSPSRSFSEVSCSRGLAAGLSFGRISVSAFLLSPSLKRWELRGSPSVKEYLAGGNLRWDSRHGTVSVTGFRDSSDGDKVSADARFCIRGVELFGEASICRVGMIPAYTAGFMIPLGGRVSAGLSARHIPDRYVSDRTAPIRAFSGKRGESGVMAALSFEGLEISSDYAVRRSPFQRQCKFTARYPWTVADRFVIDTKVAFRYRSWGEKIKGEIRTDFKYVTGPWSGVFRLNLLCSETSSGQTYEARPKLTADMFSVLTYIEGGYMPGALAAYIRLTVFRADRWSGRLYSYERDVPSVFNVPAYYGRGYSVSAYCRLKNGDVKLYLRAAFTDWPFLSPGQTAYRPSKAEFRLQAVYDF